MKLLMRWFAGVLALGVGLSGLVGVSQAVAQSTARVSPSVSYADDPAPSISVTTPASAMRSRPMPRPQRFGGLPGFAGYRPAPVGGYVPRHERAAGSVVVQQGAMMAQAEELTSPPVTGPVADMQFDVTGPKMGGDCSSCGGCGNSCNQCCLIPCPSMENTTVFFGTQGFKNNLNLDGGGSFGFHEGINWGGRLPFFPAAGLGWQIGGAGVQSNFSGASFTDDRRNQFFGTAGIFRRVDCGFQFGFVYDFMRDDWFAKTEMSQLRGEVSWRTPNRHEFGFWFTTSKHQDTAQGTLSRRSYDFVTGPGAAAETNIIVDIETTDIFAAFYRRQLECGGEFRAYAGGTNNSGGILGGDLSLPLNDCWTVQSGFAYMIPQESSGDGGYVTENWNIGLNFVWHPKGGARSGQGNYYRPLISVANNGSFFTRASIQ
jgi:hypothetical protein